MASPRQHFEIVDLLADSDDDVDILPQAPSNPPKQDRQNPHSAASQNTQCSTTPRPPEKACEGEFVQFEPPPPYGEGRVHRFDAKGIYKCHGIPNDQFSCRGCSIEPLEQAHFGKEATAQYGFRPRPRPEPSTVADMNANVDSAAGDPTGATTSAQNCTATVVIDADSPVTSIEAPTDETVTLRPDPQRNDLNVKRRASTASTTEQGSDNEDVVEVIPSTSLKSNPLSKLSNSRKGKERARSTEIDLSNLSDDDHAPSSSQTSNPAIAVDDGNQQSDDEDLRRAVALSLQDQQGLTPPSGNSSAASLESRSHDAIEISDDEEEEFRRAIALSLQVPDSVTHQHESLASTLSPSPNLLSQAEAVPEPATGAPGSRASDASTTNPTNPPSSFSLAALDRKQMEQERIKRLKRRHEADNEDGRTPKVARLPHTETPTATQSGTSRISPPPLQRHQGRRSTTVTAEPPKRNVAPNAALLNAGSNTLREESTTSTSAASPWATKPNRYPKGKVFKTFVPGYPAENTIDFATLIADASSLESCLLSSFIWDFDWLFPHFDTKRTRFQLVMHAKGASQREALKTDFQGVPNVRLCFPPMDGIVNCMHSKLMLLFYKDDNSTDDGSHQGLRCRIVVPTANLVGFDYGVGAFMENTLWLIDLPPKGSSSAAPRPVHNRDITPGAAEEEEEEEETRFEKSLKTFLRAQTVPDDVVRKLDRFDFRETAQVGFVHTIGGTHLAGDVLKSTGLCGLGRTVTDLGLATHTPIELDYVASSLGNLNDGFMSSIYLAAQGDDGMAEYDSRTVAGTGTGLRTGRGPKAGEAVKVGQDWKTNFRFYFPSDSTVRRSNGGPHNAGTICFSSKWWKNGTFPSSNMRDCISVREGLLMHNKVGLFPLHPCTIVMTIKLTPP